jgi:predicted RND superfamily exporter protein
MKFAAGLTVTGILGFLLLEALKIIMVPVTAWVMGLLAIALKIVLIVLFVLAVGVAIAIGVFFYKRHQRTAAEA